jgi:dihydroxyacetone kinase DhaKLM complex PTS-EIIA-like component DhaM
VDVVGLVLVAHSEDVVRGVAAMVTQAAPSVAVAGAGGLGGGRLGTNGIEVAAALRHVLAASGRDGVLVLLDLGSASLAVGVALEELDPAERLLVRLTEAPFVEGAVLAGVAAASGADLAAVAAAAEGAAAMPKWPRD